MPTIYVNGQSYEVSPGQNLLAACLALGFDLPFFCWHPGMGSVGACRQCAVKRFKDENDTEGEIVMACLTPAEDGTRISIDDPEAKAFRAGVIEWLMANHPHDCPVCDEGGECHLQDMTVMTGHVYRRYRYPKRTFHNQDLGPFLNHEMNRCIQCYRCVRFYADYAGGDDLVAMGIRNHVYFGRLHDGRLESEFSGNLVEVCPTGVFTDKTQKDHFVRKWDLQTAPSICVHCSLGCNTIPGERYGMLRRIRSRYNGSVNGHFLCDRGRYGYEFVNAPSRLRRPVLQSAPVGAAEAAGPVGAEVPGVAEPTEAAGVTEVAQATGTGATGPEAARAPEAPGAVTPQAAVRRVAAMIQAAHQAGRLVVGIGSPRASVEANFALRTLVGPDNFFVGMADHENRLVNTAIRILREGPARCCSLRDMKYADAMLILGEDVTNTAPMLDYSVRQWLRRRPNPERLRLQIPDWNDSAVGRIVHQEPSPLYIATVAATKLDRVAALAYRGAPDDLSRLGFAVAHLLDPEAPAVPDLSDDIEGHARRIAAAFEKAERPIVISGTSCGSKTVMHAAANVAWSLHSRGEAAGLGFVAPECNSVGLGFMGGRPLSEAFAAVDEPGIDVAIVLENDLYRRCDERAVDRFLGLCRHVVVVDHSESRTSRAAEVVLPAATFAESTGTLLNNEGRAQRFFQVFTEDSDVRESRRWFGDMLGELGRPEALQCADFDTLAAAIARDIPAFDRLVDAAPTADFRIAGMKIARQSHRASGRTAVSADATVFEPPPPDDPDSALVFSMEGYFGHPPPPLLPRFWAPGWNSPQALVKFQEEVFGPLRGGDPGVCMIGSCAVERPSHFYDVPPAFGGYEGEVLVTPIHHIFGSEELSMRSPSIASCAPAPYVGLSPRDAARLGVGGGDPLTLEMEGTVRTFPVEVVPSLRDGMVVLPYGLPATVGLLPPFRARLVRPEGDRHA